MKVGDLVAGRFEVWDIPRRSQPHGVDLASGSRVVFLEDARTLPLDRHALRAAARIAALRHGDPRIATVLHTEPVVVEAGPPEWSANGAALIAAALSMIELDAALAPEGLACGWEHAWIPERGAAARAPLVPAARGLHTEEPRTFTRAEQLRWWLAERGVSVPSRATASHRHIADALAEHPDAPEGARAIAARVPAGVVAVGPLAIDFDAAIDEMEKDLAALDPRKIADRYRAASFTLPLASALHHRACVRWRDGDEPRARTDVERAIALDAHPRYLTTRALWQDARGEDARASHDAAVAALAAVAPSRIPLGDEVITVLEVGQDAPELHSRDVARTYLARAVHRARGGDLAGACGDVDTAAAAARTPLAERWMRWLAART